MPGRRDHRRAARHERLLAVAVAVERGVAAAAPRERRRDGRDRLEQLLVQHQLGTGHLGDGLDGAIVVRRPEPAGRDHEVVAGELAQPRDDLVVLVTDDADPAQLDPERVQLVGQKARVGVGDEAEQELLPGDEQRRRRPGGRHGCSLTGAFGSFAAGSTCAACVSAVTTQTGPAPLSVKVWPLTASSTFPGMPLSTAKP